MAGRGVHHKKVPSSPHRHAWVSPPYDAGNWWKRLAVTCTHHQFHHMRNVITALTASARRSPQTGFGKSGAPVPLCGCA